MGLLEDDGIDVVGHAADGAEGVALAQHLAPDVVLMDLRMPGMGGVEATRRIKGLLPRTQVVLLSAYDDEGLRSGAREAGVYTYLVKGCRGGLVVAVVYQAWAETRGLDEGAG